LLFAFLFDRYTDSVSPYLDSFITVFGLLASVKEARKILTSWVYWFVLNAFSILLYYQQGLFYYAALMIVYTLICVGGFISWHKIYKQNQAEKN
jgi:nicotinamide mononucleotide transporter